MANYPEANRLYQLALSLAHNREAIEEDYARFLKEHPEFAK